jgi:outer membrane protein TolC
MPEPRRCRREVALSLHSSIVALVGLALLASSSCTPSWYTASADRDVSGVLDEYEGRGLGGRASRIQMPELAKKAEPGNDSNEPAKDAAAQNPPSPDAAPAKPPLVLDLKTTLAIALKESRNFKDARETLYLQGLGFTFTKFRYGPQFTAAVNYVWGDAKGGEQTGSSSLGLTASQLLPTNGTISLSPNVSKSFNANAADGWTTGLGVNLTQPLLRHAGYDQYRESLTQGERTLVYAVRNFELFREQFTITTTRQFFDLVAQKRKLANFAEDLDRAKFDEERVIALRKADRVLDKDVIVQRRKRLSSESTLADARTSYKSAVELFLIELGLDPRTPVELVEQEPPFETVAYEPTSAVAVAMNNRLDVQNTRDQLEDAERHFQLARNDLLPNLDLTASYGRSGAGRTALPALDQWNTSASVSLEIPLQTIDRRNNWRTAEIEIGRQRREWDLYLDNVKSGIEAELRQLTTTERQIEISQESIEDERRNVEVLEIRLAQGTADARDLTEARQTLINEQNSLIDQKVSHLIQRLTLYKDLGLLFIGADGTWSVGVPAADGSR